LLQSDAGYSGAAIFQIETAAGLYCLRGWPQKSLPAKRILGLHRLLKHIYNQGVNQVAVPVQSKAGTTLVTENSQLWQLEPWMPGEADYWYQPNNNRLINAMSALAGWHKAAESFEANLEERDWFSISTAAISPAVTERLQRIQTWNAGKLDVLKSQISQSKPDIWTELGAQIVGHYQLACPNIGEELQAFHHRKLRLQPCLRDVWHDHVLFTGDEVTGIIDASACRTENVATDLSRLIGSLVGDNRAGWQTALQTYQQKQPLTADELQLVQLFDRSATLLSGLTWLDRYFLQGVSIPQPERVLQRLRQILSRLRVLVDGSG
jgi:Ser/Thr protein kinase RdoA (MazF antagonist)